MFALLTAAVPGMPAWAWRVLAYALLVAALVVFGWVKGNEHGTRKLTDYQAEQALQAQKIIVKQGAVTERVIKEYIEVQGKTRTVTQEVQKEVTRYVETAPRLVLDADWVRLHDRAALGAISEAPGSADGAGGETTSPEALQTVTDNYGACHRNADKLTALQEWVREQAVVK
jgi:hypothetical protein